MARTARKRALALRCPTCRTAVTPPCEDFPFCSDRCRLIDLGKWASGAYKISSPIVDPEVLEDLGNPSAHRDKSDHNKTGRHKSSDDE